MYLRTFMIVAAAALAVLPKSDAVFERQQLGSNNLRLRKEHSDAAPGFIEPSCGEMKETIKSHEDEIASLKAMLHQMKDELADERRRRLVESDDLLLPCLPSAMPSAQPSESPSSEPSNQPSSQPSAQPSESPSSEPSSQPSSGPSAQPSESPSSDPSSSPSESPSNEPSGRPSRGIIPGTLPQCNEVSSGRLLWQQRSLQDPELCLCGECDGTGQCGYSSGGGGPKGNAFCIEPADGCAAKEDDPLTVLFKPGGKNCKGTFKLGEDDRCPNGWFLTKDGIDACNGSDDKINNLDILDTSTCGAATIHTSCSCDVALCDEFDKYRLTGAKLVGGTGDLITSRCDEGTRTCDGTCGVTDYTCTDN